MAAAGCAVGGRSSVFFLWGGGGQQLGGGLQLALKALAYSYSMSRGGTKANATLGWTACDVVFALVS